MIPTRVKPKPQRPVSVKFSEDTLKRIDRAAKATNNSRHATILHLVNDALERWEADQKSSPRPSR